ncbi:hypothetical protein M0802_016533 [Mischocyttarus mexicanus]|nr:hypothetical protein M0802_016533 [Mischocyttarus mexicanus]
MMIARIILLHHLGPRLAEAFWTTRNADGAYPLLAKSSDR